MDETASDAILDDVAPHQTTRPPPGSMPATRLAISVDDSGYPASVECGHIDTIRDVTPSAPGCEECLETGSWWVHLRLCMSCGHVGCCESSPNKHASMHAA